MNRCPRCRAANRPGAEYCLECGQHLREPTRMEAARRRFAGSIVWPLLAVLVLAALGALVAIAVSRGDNGTTTLVATRLPSRTTVPRRPIFGTATTATTILPIVTTNAPPTTATAPTATTLTEWTEADAYTLVLASVPSANGRASAVEIAKRALAAGLHDVGVLDTNDFSGLQPGYFVVFTGVYESNADAATHISEAETAGFTAPYARRITR
jgi:hypothetical protein